MALTPSSVPTAGGEDLRAAAVTILYTNWRGETAVRQIIPNTKESGTGLAFWFGSTEWHPEPQWLLTADDVGKGALRDFALSGIKAWGKDAVEAALAHSLPTKAPSDRDVAALRAVFLTSDPDLPREITPLSWLKSMVDACETEHASYTLGSADPDAWREMCGEVRALVENATAELSRTHVLQPAPAVSGDADENDWRDDPSADERWNAGLDYGLEQLCGWLDIEVANVNWDAATETLDGDVRAVIGNILRQKFGDDFDFKAVVPVNADSVSSPLPTREGAGLDREAVAALPEACEPLHLVSQRGQPYGSVQRCCERCERCGRMCWPGMRGSAERWTDDPEVFAQAPDRCDRPVEGGR